MDILSVRSVVCSGSVSARDKHCKAFTPPKDPPAAPGHADRTAGGFGGAAPAALDLYGQSSPALAY